MIGSAWLSASGRLAGGLVLVSGLGCGGTAPETEMPSLNDPVSVQTVSDSTGDVLTEATVIDELSVSTPVGSEPALPPTAPPEPK